MKSVLDPEDYQQVRVYAWEAEFGQYIPEISLTNNQAHNLANSIAARYDFPPPALTLDAGCRSFAQGNRIVLRGRSKFILVHEMAHVVTHHIVERFRYIQGHGPEFVSFYMGLIRDYLGISIDFLRSIAAGQNVRWCSNIIA